MHASTRHSILPAERFDALLAELRRRGYSAIGPQLREGAISYGPLSDHAQLPIGWGDEQAPGRYRNRQRSDGAWFGFASTAQSFKRFFHQPREPLVRIRRKQAQLEVEAALPSAPQLALIGVRGCDLRGLEVLDQVMLGGTYPDAHYAARRANTFIVGVQCTAPAATCFCTSMGTGPEINSGFDIALTEITEPEPHRFLAFAGSERGASVLEALNLSEAPPDDEDTTQKLLEAARRSITRRVPTQGIERLTSNPEHEVWEQIADRCLACANCTMVCPTCFCHNVSDTTELGSDVAERSRHWDSCFTEGFSYIHGGSIRTSVKARYRQWLTHKFATWHEQFGSSGCVGCGRCISWCPVGIDVTEEIAKLIGDPLKPGGAPEDAATDVTTGSTTIAQGGTR